MSSQTTDVRTVTGESAEFSVPMPDTLMTLVLETGDSKNRYVTTEKVK